MRWFSGRSTADYDDEEDDDGRDRTSGSTQAGGSSAGAWWRVSNSHLPTSGIGTTSISPYNLTYSTGGLAVASGANWHIGVGNALQAGIEDGEPEVCVEPYIGYRAWNVQQGVAYPLLRSTADGWPWRPGKQTAECHAGRYTSGKVEKHEAPATGCHCGFWAYDDPMTVFERFPEATVMGAIVAWGKVIKGTQGLRAQFVQTAGLLAWKREPIHDHLERVYGVPVVDDLDRLTLRAQRLKDFMLGIDEEPGADD